MAWLVTATSSKFVVAGAFLLVQGRLDGKLVTLAIAPAATTSSVAVPLAGALDAHQGGMHLFKVQIRREYFKAAIKGRESMPAPGAGVRLGMDILAANPIVVDFAHHSMRLIDRHEMASVPRHYLRLTLRGDPTGNVIAGIVQSNSARRSIRLDLGHPGAMVPNEICLTNAADASLNATEETVGMGIFAGQSVIFDFSRHLIWIRKGPASAGRFCL